MVDTEHCLLTSSDLGTMCLSLQPRGCQQWTVAPGSGFTPMSPHTPLQHPELHGEAGLVPLAGGSSQGLPRVGAGHAPGLPGGALRGHQAAATEGGRHHGTLCLWFPWRQLTL